MTVNTTITNVSSKKRTAALVAAIKHDESDYEFYPTNQSMLDVIKKDIDSNYDHSPTLLDVGAGDGRVLSFLTKGSKYAIEKSKPLIQAMDRDIFIVGTEFEQQTLIDKRTDVCFSNPPYSCYEAWTMKILREANCNFLYLIIPERWRNNEKLQKLLKKRKAEVVSLGNYDFLTSDRVARAKVEIVRIDLGYERYSHSRYCNIKVDAFDLWFEENFSLQINKTEQSKYKWTQSEKEKQQESIDNELVAGNDLVSALEKLYIQELSLLMKNYKTIETLDPRVLEELDVNIDGLKSALRQRVEGLKDRYWQELFDNMTRITSRLTTSARKRMLEKLMKHTHVDFTASNAHAIMTWVIKCANKYFDDQLVTLVETITEEASIVLYKSNNKVMKKDEWRYSRVPENLERYALDYRIVLHRVGGLCNSTWEHERKQYNGLDSRAYELLMDISTVANNLNFDTTKSATVRDYTWESRKAVELEYYDMSTQTFKTLMHVRVFFNGNMHVKFCPGFIKRLNVEFGRLKGWIRSAESAASEIDVSLEEAAISFGSNVQLGSDNILTLCFSKP